ncbi:MAG: hypothetical protein UU19_C0061G0003 [Candidatus Curtissbacteria bacterium GW2011_GWD1_40_8]|nr:MAG: hypothetical protein UT95_C0046G0003 [Candidatus Curtissbacteria bacterium GW2011_GWB1_40_28]KKR61615.1 MAG: hypothetical protein UU00_C0010G0003 [Microgenomates group bacterium GW2011_GWC1_40_35]KKR75299.1 MAG: hypothetical protein UU19_C0061G0003 [Candidatus Curtissbacteria bacterium GW2011_GWD1_40_8]KKS01798.1 MAG: hypothetical protein UU53_C0007G0008 [Candidatus Curtissbacteria bacterium GW2011_GWC2_41_21]
MQILNLKQSKVKLPDTSFHEPSKTVLVFRILFLPFDDPRMENHS